jgi:hypothetical protein
MQKLKADYRAIALAAAIAARLEEIGETELFVTTEPGLEPWVGFDCGALDLTISV